MNISLPESVTVFGRRGELLATVTKSQHQFTCTIGWDNPEINTPGTLRIQNDRFNIPIEFDEAVTKDDSYTGIMVCSAAGKKITLPLSAYIQRFVDIPLNIYPTDIVVNSTTNDVHIELTNNLDRDLPVTVSLDRYANYFGFSRNILIGPNEAYNLTLTNRLPADLNLTSTVLLQLSIFDRTETVSMLIDVSQQPPQQRDLLALIIPLAIIFAAIGVAAYFVWKYRDVVFKELNKLNIWRVRVEKKEESVKIKTLKKTEQQQAIVNLFNIMKFQDKDEKEIVQRLLQSFNREEIKAALEEIGANLPALDEEAPEKA